MAGIRRRSAQAERLLCNPWHTSDAAAKENTPCQPPHPPTHPVHSPHDHSPVSYTHLTLPTICSV
eukprot:8778139-Prorocentrum_lima.AAC.1